MKQQPKPNPRGQLFALLIFIFIFFVLLRSCEGCGEEDNSLSIYSQTDSVELLKRDSVSALKAEEIRLQTMEQKKHAEKVISRLRSRFTKKIDEFQDVTFYRHKNFGEFYLNRKTLCGEVSSKGHFNFRSNYYSSNWIFHTSVTVLVSGQKIQTTTVETFDENNQTVNVGGSIWENVYYGTHKDAIVNDILELIKNNTGKTVKVRFNGRQHYDDAVIRKSDVTAILESYELANAFATLQE